jgi:hypothetical protein
MKTISLLRSGNFDVSAPPCSREEPVAAAAEAARLRYVSDRMPGITRRRAPGANQLFLLQFTPSQQGRNNVVPP